MTHSFNRAPALTPIGDVADAASQTESTETPQSGVATLLLALAMGGGAVCVALTLFAAVFAP